MEILFVTRPIVPPWNEGSKNLVWQLACHLTRHTPHLLTTTKADHPNSPRVNWHNIYSEKTLSLKQKLRLLGYLAFKPQPVDLYHFYFVPTLFTSRILSAICRFHRKRSVQTIPSLPASLPPPERLRELIFADHVIVYSQHTRSKLVKWGIENVTQIGVGIDTAQFTKAEPDPDLRKRFRVADNDVLVLFAGEYARLGSVAVLKRIIPTLISRCSRCHLLIACRILSQADLTIEADLKLFIQDAQVAHRVHFVGEVSNFPSLLKTSDIFLFPATNMQGKIDAPLTILEAMAAGLPVLTNELSPLEEIFASDSLALATDEGMMIERLLLMAANPKLRQREGSRWQRVVQERHDMMKMVEAHEALYDSLGQA